ncbi:MAG: molybdopterin-synthase adenylyltransferase MoeB [Arenimonas sp.]|jgi:molybdopterin/thiamine biosynthesis adenylyltransferase
MKPVIIEISPASAREMQERGARLIDVREPDEHALGVPAGALAVPRAALEAEPAEHHPERDESLLLICGSGRRSLLAAQALAEKGYCRLYSVVGGFAAWQAARLPVQGSQQDADFLERYSRHLRLPQVGLDGQKALEKARVLVVGAGGLGSPAAFYLAAAGVGFLRLVDDDVVDRSNLQRQILHTDDRIGRPKVESATQSLQALNPRTRIDAQAVRLSAENIEALISDVDVILDGADNFPTRYLLSDACVNLAKPLVYGAVHRFEGQVSVFDAGRHRGEAPCYRCLFPEAPSAEVAPNCAEAGVLGVLPGIIGLLQATEALKLILELGESLSGRLLHFDALAMRFRETRLRPDPDCAVCAVGRQFPGYQYTAEWCRAG